MEIKIVHGRPRHSQSQASVVRSNQDIEQLLSTWFVAIQQSKLKLFQFTRNKSQQTGINRSPHESYIWIKTKYSFHMDCDNLMNVLNN